MAEAVNVGITAGSERIAQQVRANIRKGHGGVVSKPLSPPNSQTGNLKNSWNVIPAKSGRGYIGTGLDYSRFLERGTVTMQPRPYAKLSLAQVAASRSAQNAFTAAAARYMRRAAK